MSAKQQKGNRSAANCGARLSRREGFWPFDPLDPLGKETATLGADSGYSSIKNYPSVTRAPVGKDKQTPARKRVTKK